MLYLVRLFAVYLLVAYEYYFTIVRITLTIFVFVFVLFFLFLVCNSYGVELDSMGFTNNMRAAIWEKASC
jgi:hypothetical protein